MKHKLTTIREILTVNILAAMQHPQHDNPIIVEAEIKAPSTVGKSPKAGAYPIARYAGQTKFCDFIHLAHQIIDKTLCRYRVILCDIGINVDQVRLGRFRKV